MKEFFYGILALLVMIIISVVSVLLVIHGATFIFESWLVLLVIGVLGLFLTIDIVVFTLPLVLKVMPFALQVFTISSYVYGSILWLLSIYISHKVFGVFWLVSGLLFAGVGVLPIAIFGVILKQWWPILYLILFLLVLTFITRYLPVLAIAIISVFEERSEINDYIEAEDYYTYLDDDSDYLKKQKLIFPDDKTIFKKKVKSLVLKSNLIAVSSTTRFIDKYPLIEKLVKVDTIEKLNFYITVAGIGAALTMLDRDLPIQYDILIMNLLHESLDEWHPESFDSLLDLKESIESASDRGLGMNFPLGMWVIRSLKNSEPSGIEEVDVALEIGQFILIPFVDYWKDDNFLSQIKK